ncbi:hypothetical protein [Ruegeria arenilitoris]|nr:hypothetical protein [Ruegeria arenilitoris]
MTRSEGRAGTMCVQMGSVLAMTRTIALVQVLAVCTPDGDDPRSVLTRPMLDRQGQPALLAELPKL